MSTSKSCDRYVLEAKCEVVQLDRRKVQHPRMNIQPPSDQSECIRSKYKNKTLSSSQPVPASSSSIAHGRPRTSSLFDTQAVSEGASGSVRRLFQDHIFYGSHPSCFIPSSHRIFQTTSVARTACILRSRLLQILCLPAPFQLAPTLLSKPPPRELATHFYCPLLIAPLPPTVTLLSSHRRCAAHPLYQTPPFF